MTFVTGSRVIWGAELSLLSLAQNFPEPPDLITSNPALATAWLSSVQRPATLLSARAGRLTRNAGFFWPIMRAAKTADVIVVFDFYLLPTVLLLKPFLRARSTRVVVDVHDAQNRNHRRRVYFEMMRVCDLAIAVSDFVLRQLPHGPAARRRIYRPVTLASRGETSPASSRDAPDGAPRVGLVGQISPDKNLEAALRAIAQAGAPAQVVMRGGTTEGNRGYHAEIVNLARELFGDDFSDEGRVPQNAAMKGLDILVLTNDNEPFGRVAAEAQLAGVLAVGPDAGGIGEILTDGETGFTYRVDERGSLADAIRRAIRECSSGTGVVERARQNALDLFDPARQSREYFDALQRA
ncbi:glycosyltransferase family 4 protein [Microbacterium jejuense]|uniref:Glycosyltransferase family 4 protein n=1 Tax=Microbacterium jejuense TaxID=1263637 RepID=A0ABS7HPH9_9MICO|nr:glycosyltransferase family 4 protein [Microbacterium jejuense]MBW9094151.1 glycosyltransferase family 4 protein [Microbacterium jejuense]